MTDYADNRTADFADYADHIDVGSRGPLTSEASEGDILKQARFGCGQGLL